MRAILGFPSWSEVMATHVGIQTKVDAGDIVVLVADQEIARMYERRTPDNKYRLVLEVDSTKGVETFELALSMFRHQRSFGMLGLRK